MDSQQMRDLMAASVSDPPEFKHEVEQITHIGRRRHRMTLAASAVVICAASVAVTVPIWSALRGPGAGYSVTVSEGASTVDSVSPSVGELPVTGGPSLGGASGSSSSAQMPVQSPIPAAEKSKMPSSAEVASRVVEAAREHGSTATIVRADSDGRSVTVIALMSGDVAGQLEATVEPDLPQGASCPKGSTQCTNWRASDGGIGYLYTVEDGPSRVLALSRTESLSVVERLKSARQSATIDSFLTDLCESLRR